MKYDFAAVEKKWQDIWEEKGCFHATIDYSKPKFYGLVEFPYPSGQGLHVGHPRSYTAIDAIVPSSAGCRATTCSTRWGGTPSACPPKTTPLQTRSIRPMVTQQQRGALQVAASGAGHCPLTGRGKSTPPTRTTTSGRSGFSSSFSRRALPTRRRCRSTGAPPARCVLANEEVVRRRVRALRRAQ